jgi:dihydroorotase
MTVDDWYDNAFNLCKPVAKTPADRVALVQAVVDQGGKFFFGK